VQKQSVEKEEDILEAQRVVRSSQSIVEGCEGLSKDAKLYQRLN
jgi:hypothetical protein